MPYDITDPSLSAAEITIRQTQNNIDSTGHAGSILTPSPSPSIPPTSIQSFPTSPAHCGVLNLMQSGQAFSSGATSAISAVLGQIGQITSLIENLPSILSSIGASLIANFKAMLLSTISGVIANLTAHIASQLAGLVGNLSLAVSHIAAQVGLAGAGGGCGLPSNESNPPTDNCFNMSKIFGSIFGVASDLMGKIGSALSGVTSAIGAAVSAVGGAIGAAVAAVSLAVNTAMSVVTAITSQITAMIASELAAISAMINELLNFANVSSLFGLLNNTCARAAIGALSTPALATQVGLSPAEVELRQSAALTQARLAARQSYLAL